MGCCSPSSTDSERHVTPAEDGAREPREPRELGELREPRAVAKSLPPSSAASASVSGEGGEGKGIKLKNRSASISEGIVLPPKKMKSALDFGSASASILSPSRSSPSCALTSLAKSIFSFHREESRKDSMGGASSVCRNKGLGASLVEEMMEMQTHALRHREGLDPRFRGNSADALGKQLLREVTGGKLVSYLQENKKLP